METEPEKDCVS